MGKVCPCFRLLRIRKGWKLWLIAQSNHFNRTLKRDAICHAQFSAHKKNKKKLKSQSKHPAGTVPRKSVPVPTVPRKWVPVPIQGLKSHGISVPSPIPVYRHENWKKIRFNHLVEIFSATFSPKSLTHTPSVRIKFLISWIILKSLRLYMYQFE